MLRSWLLGWIVQSKQDSWSIKSKCLGFISVTGICLKVKELWMNSTWVNVSRKCDKNKWVTHLVKWPKPRHVSQQKPCAWISARACNCSVGEVCYPVQSWLPRKLGNEQKLRFILSFSWIVQTLCMKCFKSWLSYMKGKIYQGQSWDTVH